ncbi:MAG: tRNA lysidine(34) synthetase TilS [Candidatus Cloacimonetes bacterium]|nr:tRNA lysidine(34) synthetase TilS [Candidatus Cloacimonadota bacterium]
MNNRKNLVIRLKQFIHHEDLIEQGDKLLIGVSGGIDSTVLLYLLKKITAEFKLTTLAAHINYNLRGDESKENERFVKDLCYKWGIPLIVHNVTIADNVNVENTARKIRYGIFRDLLKKYNFHKIVVGHNMNDQAETFLMHLFRGSGFTGLKGMLPKGRDIIRPLLGFKRDEIEAYAEKHKIQFSPDSSNDELDYDRNKIRHLILPVIQEQFNPTVINKIYDSSHIFQKTDTFLQTYSKDIFRDVVLQHDDEYVVLLDKLRQSEVLYFYVFRRVFGLLTGSESDFYSSHLSEIYELLRRSGGKFIHLPHNVYVIKNANTLIFKTSPPDYTASAYSREINHYTRQILFDDYYITQSEIKVMPIHGFNYNEKDTCYIDFDKVTFPLIARYRRPGDSFFPLGMQNPKTLKKFFIDKKVPRLERKKKIIIQDQKKIIWIAGMRISESVKITSRTTHVLRIKIMKKLEDYRRARRL